MKFTDLAKRYWWAGLAVVVVIVGGVFGLSLLNRPEADHPADSTAAMESSQTATSNPDATETPRQRILMTAQDDSVRGIGTKTGFVLTAPKGVRTENLAGMIQVKPKFSFKLLAAEGGAELVPDQPLAPGQIYRFTLDSPDANIHESWAFQTRRDFRMVSTLPADRGTGVPVNSGVEIRFSDPDFEGIENRFLLEPVLPSGNATPVDGRWEIHKETAVFVPNQELLPGTVYSATLKAGIRQKDSGQEIARDAGFSFQTLPKTPPSRNKYMGLINLATNSPSNKVPYFPVACDEKTLTADWNITVWKYADADAFQNALSLELTIPYWADREIGHIPETAHLAKLRTFKANVQPDEYATLLVFPDTLPEGHYLMMCEADGLKAFGFLQVHDMMLFLSIAETNTLAWANDLLTDAPLPQVALKGYGDAVATTGKDGTVLIPGRIYPDDAKIPTFLRASRPEHPDFVAVLSAPSYGYDNGWYGAGDRQKAYWHYLFTERSTYLPSDTASFWGVLKPRDIGKGPETLTVTLEKNDYWSYDGESGLTVDTLTVPVGARGTYEGQFVFEKLEPGSYNLVVRDGETELDRTYLGLYQYEKPVFLVDATVREKVILPGETAAMDVKGRFFEGTPVPGLEMNASFSYGSSEIGVQTLILDSQGEAQATATIPETAAAISWQPIPGSFNANARNPEEADIYLYESFTVFPRDTMTWMETTMDKGTFTADIHVHRIDLRVAKSEIASTNFMTDMDKVPYKGAAADIPVHGIVFEHYWDRKVTGKGYDFVNKLSYDRYEYFEVDRSIAEFDGSTVQGILKKTMTIPDFHDDRDYRLTLTLKDAQGRSITETKYLNSWYSWNGYGGQEYYQLEKVDNQLGYRVGDTVALGLMKNGRAFDTTGSNLRILYLLAREGHVTQVVSKLGTQNFLFEKAYMPNIMAKAVLFDGNRMMETDTCIVQYDASERKLTVDAVPDAASYKPGQDVIVNLSVADAAGNPVEASVNLAVVDEAYFSLYGQSVDPLGSIYSPVFGSGIVGSYISHEPYDPAAIGTGGAEGGEGDDTGNPVRKDFKDTAWFGSTITDASGKGRISFKLPDNLTSFRVTAQAVTDDLKAGTDTSPIVSTLPFFVQLVSRQDFMEGDAPTILLRAYGTGRTEKETRFTVTLATENGKSVTMEAMGTGAEYVGVPLGALPTGTAILTVKGVNGEHADIVQRSLHVAKNLLTVQKTSFLQVKEGMTFEAVESLATFTVYNRKYATLYQTLWDLYGSYGSRVDMMLARRMAADYLKNGLVDPYVTTVPDEDFSPWQKEDGGIALLPYDSSDVLLTAKICSVNTDPFDTNRLRPYFTTIVQDETSLPMHVAAAMWGLASLGDPVLLDVRSFLAGNDPKDDEKIIFALSLADLGDIDGATALYGELAGKYGKQGAPYRWFDFGRDKDDMLQMTALAAMLAQKIGHADRDALYAYLQKNRTVERPVVLEQLALLKGRVEAVSNMAGAILIVDGKTHPIRLKGSEVFQLLVKPEQISGTRFENITGDLEMTVSSRGSATTLDTGNNRVASIQRQYRVDGVVTDTVGPQDSVEVVLTLVFEKDAPQGGYELSDLLPAGLHYTYGQYSAGDDWYWWQPDGQQIRLVLYHKGGSATRTLHYWARVSGAGSFSADPAVLKHEESDACGFSEPARITVKAP